MAITPRLLSGLPSWESLALPASSSLSLEVQSASFSLKMQSSFLLQGFGPVAPGMLFLETSDAGFS